MFETLLIIINICVSFFVIWTIYRLEDNLRLRERRHKRKLFKYLRRTMYLIHKLKEAITPQSASVLEMFWVNDEGIRERFYEMFLQGKKQVVVGVTPKDAQGNVAQIENLKWVSTNEAIGTVEGDGAMGATVKTTGAVGTFEVQCSGDAKIGEGENIILASASFEVLPGEAVTLELSVGEATDI